MFKTSFYKVLYVKYAQSLHKLHIFRNRCYCHAPLRISRVFSMTLQVLKYSLRMIPRHLPKKLLCVALIGTSILAVIYYTNGISNLSVTKLTKSTQENQIPENNQHKGNQNIHINGKMLSNVY